MWTAPGPGRQRITPARCLTAYGPPGSRLLAKMLAGRNESTGGTSRRAEPEMNHQQNDDHQQHQHGKIFCVHRGWSGMLRNHRVWPPADTCLARIAFHFSRFSFAQTFWRSLRHQLEQIILRGCGRSIPTSRPHCSHGFGMSEYANQDFLWQRSQTNSTPNRRRLR